MQADANLCESAVYFFVATVNICFGVATRGNQSAILSYNFTPRQTVSTLQKMGHLLLLCIHISISLFLFSSNQNNIGGAESQPLASQRVVLHKDLRTLSLSQQCYTSRGIELSGGVSVYLQIIIIFTVSQSSVISHYSSVSRNRVLREKSLDKNKISTYLSRALLLTLSFTSDCHTQLSYVTKPYLAIGVSIRIGRSRNEGGSASRRL